MTTAYVATIGGHITELVELAARLPDDGDQVWITNGNAQTRDLLRGRRVELVPFVGERDAAGVLRSIPAAWRLLRDNDISRVVSTGSAIALSYLPVAASLGIDAHYIESSTRVATCSMTGRILARTPGVGCWWQFDDPPPRFRHLGGVYDGFATSESATEPELQRIVVTVGTTDRDFRRLIERLVTVVPKGAEVLWQTGSSDLSGLGVDGRELVPEAELAAAMTEADVVIAHAGTGSLSLALRAGKVPVFVPRRARFGEQLDDHQVELARWAGARGLAVPVEADRVDRSHLEAAARRNVTLEPVGRLLLR
ncbi:MAG: glycosyl transferase family 28 [Acidimicrobiia bacterium]|nr:glycosyl transferase family 28 [Acidimicrobiia bacterium]